LWNAHVATGVPLAELAAGFDTVSVCLSKGLGAPIGSLLVSSAERIEQAWFWRKRYGGAMRQVGILAAAGRFALQNNLNRLAEDHARARRLAAELGRDPAGSQTNPAGSQTNIVVLDVPDALAVSAAAREQGVWTSVVGPRALRLVTHLDVDDRSEERRV